MADLYPRWQKTTVKSTLGVRRVLLLTGPRQCGKTTLASQFHSEDTEYRTLDDHTLLEAARADPVGFVKHDSKTLILDEVQREPALFTAIKKVVDENNRPGQYLLTGSSNIQSLPGVQESLAGRISKIRLRPLTIGERNGKESPEFIANAFNQKFSSPTAHTDRDALLDYAFAGGFPEALTLEGRQRKRWHRDYIDALLERDLKDIVNIRRKDAMGELVSILAAWSGKFMDISAIGRGLSVKRPTLETYINALESLYLVERVRPWTKTDYERAGKQSKLFVADSGLMASLLNWRPDQVRLDSDRSGKLIETLAFHEIVAQVDAAEGAYTLFHYRDREKREIDFVIERDDGSLLGIEIKAGASVGKRDFNHLRWFQETLATEHDFVGIVLYSGEHVASFGDNLWAVPFTTLCGIV